MNKLNLQKCKVIIYSIFLILSINSLIAQNSKEMFLYGRIVDQHTNDPLIGANIVLPESHTGTSTDMDGVFYISIIPTNEKQVLEISYIGYETLKINVQPGSQKLNLGTIKLSDKALETETVIVEAKPPIAVQKGDTLSFSSASVKVQDEASALQIVKKLPGFNYENNKIETQGEKIEKVYVNGELYFSDDPKNALLSLPSEIIKSIEVFDDYGEISEFTGYNSGSKVKALNIVTTKNGKNIVLGNITGGVGNKDQYLFGANTHIASDKHNLAIVSDVNNLNKSNSDLGEFKTLEEEIASQISKSVIMESDDEALGEKTYKSIGLNYNGQFSNKFKISSNYTFGKINEYFLSTKEQNYQDQFFQNTIDTTDDARNLHKFFVKADYQPSEFSKFIIQEKTSLATGSIAGNSNHYSSYNDVGNVPSTSKTLYSPEKFYSNSSLIWLRKFPGSNKTISVIGNYIYNNAQYEKNSEINRNYGIQHNAGLDTISTFEDKLDNSTEKGNKAYYRVSYKFPITSLSNFHLTHGATYVWANSTKQTMGFNDSTNSYSNNYEALQNKSSINQKIRRFEAGFSAFSLRTDLNLGLAYERADLDNQTESINPTNYQSDYNYLLPFIYGKYYISSNKNIVLFGRSKSILPTLSQTSNYVDLYSATEVFAGNPKLKPGLQHMAMLRYIATNPAESKIFSLYGFVNYSSKFIGMNSYFVQDTTTTNGVKILPGTKVTQSANLTGFFNTMAGGNYSFPINYLKSNFNTDIKYGFMRLPTILSDVLYNTYNHMASIKVALVSNISKELDYNISYRTDFNFAENNNTETFSQYMAHKFNTDLNLIVWKSIKLNMDYHFRYYDYFGKNTDQSVHLLNLSVGKKILKDNKGSIDLAFYDVLNQNKGVLYSLHETYTETLTTNTVKPYVMLQFNYRF